MGLFQKYSPSKGVPQKAFQTNQGNGLLMLSTRGIPLKGHTGVKGPCSLLNQNQFS